MFAFLSQMVFMQPILLYSLLGLPVLWYILRITPPAPRVIAFPPARFLANLVSEQRTPSKSPWWILLLRLLIVALIVIGLARPVVNPADSLPGYGALRLIVDNSWASTSIWDTQVSAGEEAIVQASREGREIYITTTTAVLGEETPEHLGPLSEGDALSVLRGLQPNPWPADYDALIETLKEHKERQSFHSVWLSHGLDEGNIRAALNAAQSQGGLTYVRPSESKTALVLRQTRKTLTSKNRTAGRDIRIDIEAARGLEQLPPVTVQALGEKGAILDIQSTSLSETPQTITFEITDTLQDNLTQFKISGRYGAGGLYLLDDSSKKRKVGIAASADDASSAPLIEASYYIKRALEPFANISIAPPLQLIEEGHGVIILPDVAAMPTATLNALENWVNEGGLLLRFSGPKMAENRTENFLLPVALRAGGRSLSGSLSWDEAQQIKPFEENSPFYGLEIPDDVEILQQVLADPAQELEGKVWAHLTDGTPFITASNQEKGLLVLVHTTANADWSNFALSGLYVSVLRRIIGFSGRSQDSANANFKTLEPLLMIDGFGALQSPPATVRPVPIEAIDKLVPSSVHPPGLYGSGSYQFAFNLGTNLPALQLTDNLPISIAQSSYEKDYEIDLMPYFLYAAFMLFLLDWLVMSFVIGNALSILQRRAIGVFVILCLVPVNAFANDEADLRYASGFYLAYVESGDNALDQRTRAGLESLSKTLFERTSVEPKGVVGLNPESDTLSFFPLIYWAMSGSQKTYSDKAIENIQYYLDHGGTILFDTRDQNRSTTSVRNTDNAKALRRVTGSLNIPPITPIPDDHVLGRAFYLLRDYPGLYTAGTLWVEKYSAQGRDNVSSVLIGSNDWAGSWAETRQQTQFGRFGSNTSDQQKEMAMRFGVNLVMYALTGNYKADQVHIPHILKRLDR